MAKYGKIFYKGAYYGEPPRFPFSVEPFTATAIDYDRILLTWSNPTGAINGMRLVRNQEGFGECPEDGVVLFERNGDPSTFGDTVYTDGEDNFLDSDPKNDIGLVSGRWTYYSMWVRRDTDLWVKANDLVVLLPKEHGTSLPDGSNLLTTHINFMDLLPRVFTSAEQSPLGVVDPSSDLYQFLDGMSFTVDEIITLAELLLPDFSGKNYNPGILELKSLEFGLAEEEPEAVIRKKRMTREALYMYARKGTLSGLSTMIEALTGFAPRITRTKNLFLSNQDSTFNKSTGYWRTVGPATLTVETKVLPPTKEEEPKSIDDRYCAKFVSTDATARMEVGAYRPVTRGIPVTAATQYQFSYYAKTPSSISPNAVSSITWYNKRGETISTTSSTSSTTVGTDWARVAVTGTAPGESFTVESYSVTDDVVTVVFTADHSFSSSDTVEVAGLGAELDGFQTVLSTTADSITYAKTTEDVESTTIDYLATVSTEAAVYASVSARFTLADTYYVDLFQFAESSDADPDPAYEEARGVNVFLESSKENYIKNPSFDDTTAGWDITGEASFEYTESTLPYVFAGDSMLAVTTAEDTEMVISASTAVGDKPVDKSYVFSTYASVADGTETVKLQVTATDGTNTTVATSADVELTTTWSRPYVEVYVDDAFDNDLLEFTVEVISEAPTGGIIQLEAAQLEEAYQPSDYFDGSFPAEYGITWSGDEHDSSSHCYKNKQVKIIRLIQELENYLPSNTPYFVSSYAGTEVTGITM
jgi:hypothetical protein